MTFQQVCAQPGAATLSGHYYTAPEIFYQETQRIFYNHWLCVGRSEQISEAGDYFLAQIGEENLILLRDAEGIARAFFNVCRHRGTRLCTQAQGHLAESIQCPYHGWTYSLEGQLCTARQMPPAGFAKDNPLFACALHEWEGFLWVNLAPNPAPFTQTFAPLLDRFAPWRLASLRLGQQRVYEVQANWKLLFQTYSQQHRSTARCSVRNLSTGTFLGGYRSLERPAGGLSWRASQRSPLPAVRGDNRFRVYYYLLFPTMLLSLHPDYVVAHRLYPQSEHHTSVVCEWLFDRSVASSLARCTDAIEAWEFTNRQNWHSCEVTHQRLMAASSLDEEPHPLAAFDHEYLRVLGR